VRVRLVGRPLAPVKLIVAVAPESVTVPVLVPTVDPLVVVVSVIGVLVPDEGVIEPATVVYVFGLAVVLMSRPVTVPAAFTMRVSELLMLLLVKLPEYDPANTLLVGMLGVLIVRDCATPPISSMVAVNVEDVKPRSPP